ncbi:MAG TPA: hypothetical protein VLK56_00345 [Solirubrobacterales bacterium]|nr:hypothetical protein [Solirubrobacterales bacterium]
MRDPLLNEALRRLAAEAATRFTTLVASGDQIPFDVAEQAGPDEALFHSYVPLTARFVREREAELLSLPAFEPARDAVALAGVAAPYLEQRGEAVPSVPSERATRLLTIFIASLWDGCTEFSLDRDRLESALAVLDAEAGNIDEAEIVVVPIVGLQMPVARLQLPHGAQLVRADSFEAPIEAMRSEGMGRAAWEPQFLAIAEQGEGADSAAAALRQLGDLISVMRLFKGGGVGLGPHAFAPTGEGRWRRIATGSPAPRGEGYELNEGEAAELTEFAGTLEARPDPAGPLAWAVSRYELGCERPSALEGLSDHLLALRAVLDGQGPVGASLPMRAAALIADGSTDRLGARERVEAAMELERAQMAGGSSEGAGELAAWVEECVRRILREAALGELGTDLNEAADETLIATGLDAGDVEIAVTAQDIEPSWPAGPVDVGDPPPPAVAKASSGAVPPTPPPAGEAPAVEAESYEEEYDMDQDTRILEPVPTEHEIRITATSWLDEVDVSDDVGTIEWPAGGSDVDHRERIDTPRVRHLFPVPEDAEWEVKELRYDHYGGRSAS